MLEQNKARKWIRRGRNMYVRIITHHFMPSGKSTITVFHAVFFECSYPVIDHLACPVFDLSIYPCLSGTDNSLTDFFGHHVSGFGPGIEPGSVYSLLHLTE